MFGFGFIQAACGWLPLFIALPFAVPSPYAVFGSPRRSTETKTAWASDPRRGSAHHRPSHENAGHRLDRGANSGTMSPKPNNATSGGLSPVSYPNCERSEASPALGHCPHLGADPESQKCEIASELGRHAAAESCIQCHQRPSRDTDRHRKQESASRVPEPAPAPAGECCSGTGYQGQKRCHLRDVRPRQPRRHP